MIELKKLDIPSSTLNLKDFSDYCKTFSNYEEYAEFYTNQIKTRKSDLNNFAVKILREHFIKDEIEWSKILSEKDFNLLLESRSKNFEDENQIFVKCNKTNTFFNLSETFYSMDKHKNLTIDYIEDSLKNGKILLFIKNQKIELDFNYTSDYYKAPYRNRDGSYRKNNEIYTIDLLDYSVNYEHKSRTVVIPSEIPHNQFG